MDIITANELLSGATVYLYADGRWDADIDQARVFTDGEGEELEEALKKARANGRLVSVESEKVSVEDGRVIAQRLRERIRAEGPTAPRHEPQHLQEGDHVSL